MRRRILGSVALVAVLLGLTQIPLFAAQTLGSYLPDVFGSYLPLAFRPEVPTSTPLPTQTPVPEVPTARPTATPTNTPIPTSAPQPTATPSLPPPSYQSCGTAPAGAPDYPVKITAINKSAETVTIRNVSASAVDVTGWRICSIVGAQQHAILSGTLQPGESQVIASQAGGPIWNNETSDPGALWTNDGSAVSSFS